MTKAEQLLREAQTAGAKIYAEEEFAAAKVFLAEAKESIEQKDFAKAKKKALLAIASAEEARKLAMVQQTKLKREMEKSLVELKANVNAMTPADSMASKKIEVAKDLIKDAETAFKTGDLAKAKQKMEATRFLIEELQPHPLDNPPPDVKPEPEPQEPLNEDNP